jgi:rod shape-determining protein MreD
MKNLKLALAILIIAVIQATLLDYFKVLRIKPDLLLISVILVSLAAAPKWALTLSAFAGALKDFLTAAPGGNFFLFFLWSLVIIRLHKEIPIDNGFLFAAIAFIISLLHNIASGLILKYCGNFIALGIFLRTAALSAIYTAAVALLAPPIYRRFS